MEGHFRTKASARRHVMKEPLLPEVIREVLLTAINSLDDDTDERFIHVKATGHQLLPDQSNGNHQVTSATLVVEPMYFTPRVST
jgi:hypothetical protein